ncbi:MAG TPA: hypothetical protein V6D14_35130, partial [Coleofasciculaceae cyanobacterium]
GGLILVVPLKIFQSKATPPIPQPLWCDRFSFRFNLGLSDSASAAAKTDRASFFSSRVESRSSF